MWRLDRNPYGRKNMKSRVPATAIYIIGLLLSFYAIVGKRLDLLALAGEADIASDAFYHVKVAELGPRWYTGKTFPAMYESVWTTNFYDKELGFHLLLSLVTTLKKALSLPLRAPFHIESALLVAMALIGFLCCTKYLHYSAAQYFGLTLLFSISSVWFTNRLTLVRPHLLSIAYLMVYTGMVSRIRSEKKLWLVIALAWLFVYLYSSPHLIFIPTFAWACCLIRRKPRLAVLLMASAGLGFLFGMTIHPQFPNTWILWKIQAVDVIFQARFDTIQIPSAFEAKPIEWKYEYVNAGLYILCSVNILGTAILVIRRRLTRTLLYLIALQTIGMLVYWFVTARMIEYFAPWSVLASGELYRTAIAQRSFRPFGRYISLPFAAVTITVFCLGTGLWYRYRENYAVSPAYAEFEEWAKTVPAGTKIANLHFSDFPLIFYAAPHCRYMVGLDQMFGYAHNFALYKEIDEFKLARRMIDPDRLYALVHAPYMFLSYENEGMRHYIAKHLGYRVILQSNDMTVYCLLPACRKFHTPANH